MNERKKRTSVIWLFMSTNFLS